MLLAYHLGSQELPQRHAPGVRVNETSDFISLGTEEFDIGTMRPFFSSCDRQVSSLGQHQTDSQGYGATLQNITITDSSGDEAFAPEILSPASAQNFNLGDASSTALWSNQPISNSLFMRHERSLGNIGDEASSSKPAHPPQARCNKVGRRFLSLETMASISHCRYEERADARPFGSQDSLDIFVDRGAARESEVAVSTCDLAKRFGFASDNHGEVNRTCSDELERIYKQESSVLREIDIAVSMAHSRFKSVESCVSDDVSHSPAQDEIRSTFSSYQLDAAHGDSSSHIASISREPELRVDARLSTTKDYASHSMCSIVDKWKRKSCYQSSVAPIHKTTQCFGLAQSGNYSQGATSYCSAERSEIYSASGAVSDRNFNSEAYSSESTSELRQSFETKIDSSRDERSAASYAPGPSSAHAQLTAQKLRWPQKRRHKEQYTGRSKITRSERGASAESGRPEIDDKPVNLCLQQAKVLDDKSQTTLKLAKSPAFKVYTKSLTNREKPSQTAKRRTKSQCSLREGYPAASASFAPDCAGLEISGQGSCGMVGTGSRSDLENFKGTSFTGGQGSTPDANLGSLFSTSEASHMMVQDDMKTYAVLSGRRNEDVLNSHALSAAGAAHQQQSPYQQARHSHSIINYAGPHGQSPDIRTVDLSPSPPVREHRATASGSLPGLLPQAKNFSNVIVAHRQHQHSMSPSHQEDYQSQETFQRPFEPQNIFQTRQPHHQQQSPMSHGHHPGTSSFSPLQLSPQQQQHQQTSSFVVKHHQQRRDYFENISSHSGLATVGSMAPYAGSLQVSQTPHGSYLKPPPVDLDELSEDERERMRIKRERNRVAAAKCRNRRRELLERLEKEAEQLEREQELLRENVRRLRVQKLQLGNLLEEHEPTCHKTLVEEEPKQSPADDENRAEKEEQATSAISGGRDNNESPAKNTTSPLQLTTQA